MRHGSDGRGSTMYFMDGSAAILTTQTSDQAGHDWLKSRYSVAFVIRSLDL